jgi:hypothetical protein
MTEARDEDDLHCTVLEVIAGASGVINLDDNVLRSYLLKLVGKGDGSLVPTIACALRVGLVGVRPMSLVPKMTDVELTPKSQEQLVKLYTLLTSEEKSTLMKTRMLVVLNNAILIDFLFLRKIELEGLRSACLKNLADESTTEQIRDIASGILARLCKLEGPQGQTETAVHAVVGKLLAHEPEDRDSHTIGEEAKDDETGFGIQVKVSVLQLVARVVKFRRHVPEWVIPDVVKIALECVGNHKEEIKREGFKFFQLLARFITLEQAERVCTDSGLHLHSPKEKQALIALLSNSLVNSIVRSDSLLWRCDNMKDCLTVHFFKKFHDAIFVQHVHSPVRVDEAASPEVIASAADSITDLLVIVSAVVDVQCPARPGSICGILTLVAITTVASLFFDVPIWGVEAVGKLAQIAAKDVPPNVKRIVQTAIADFLKTQTNRGTRETTEKLFDSDILSLVRATKSKHSYIS